MTDSTAPEGTAKDPDSPEVASETQPDDERTVDPTRDGDDLPGSTTSAAPLTDSTDGGLDGGDPGVEE